MKKTKRLIAIMICLMALSSFGFSNGLNLNGLGARMVSMGGAFVGLANDYSAVLWNPAGLAQLKGTTFGVTGDFIMPSATYQLGAYGIDTKTESKIYPTGMAGFFLPVSDNIVAGISVYTPSGLGATWPGADLALLAGIPPPVGTGNADIIWESKIGVITISPAVAVNIDDMFYVGAALNINYGMFDIQRTAGFALFEDVPILLPDQSIGYFDVYYDLGQYTESSTGWGYGATLGLLVKPIEEISVGMTFRTASKVKFEGDASIEGFDSEIWPLPPSETTFTRDVTSPMFLAFGLAVHPAENITIAADVHYTNWSKLERIQTGWTDLLWQVVLAEEGDLNLMWKDQIQIRAGAEYWLNDSVAVRVGYYNDPAPSPDTTMNVLVPNYDFNAFSAGLGIVMNGFTVDLCAEYLLGKERNISLLDLNNEMPGVYGMNILALSVSLIYQWMK